MKLIPSIHKAVLAGVARSPIADSAAASAAPLQALLTTLNGDAQLWHAVAASDLWQRAGYQPAQSPEASPPADGDALCPQAAERSLQLILRGIHADLLPQWLALARASGIPLPHSALAHLLDLGLQKPALRSALSDVLGARGAWLVAQHPEWRVAYGTTSAGDDAASRWELGTLAQRVDALRAMRVVEPEQARAKLEAAWSQEPPENRAALLPCLTASLSLADEAFLETVLDDKRKEVRTAAIQLLKLLDDSQLVQRCKSRLESCLSLQRGMLGLRNQLVITLPEACDKAMKRDGVGVNRHGSLGEKAGWILDMMSCISPSYWSEKFDLGPEKVVAVMAGSEFKEALLEGLLQAAAATTAWTAGPHAREWFLALFNGAGNHVKYTSAHHTLIPALPRLSYEDQEQIVRGWLGATSARSGLDHAVAWAVQHSQVAQLNMDMSRLILSSVQRHFALRNDHLYYVRSHMSTLQPILDASDPAYAQHGWPADSWEHWPESREMVDQFMETLKFRHIMQASFLETDA